MSCWVKNYAIHWRKCVKIYFQKLKVTSMSTLLRLCSFIIFFLVVGCIQTEIVPEILEPRITLATRSLSLTVGQSSRIEANYTDAQNNNRPDLLQWRTRNAAIAEVNNDGRVTARAPGQTWIVASTPDMLADSALVTVVADNNAVAVVEIVMPPSALLVSTTLQLSARVFNHNGNLLNGKPISWNSSNPSVLSVSASGLLMANATGSASITAISEGISSLPVNIVVNNVNNTTRTGTFQGNAGYNVSGGATLQMEGNALKVLFNSDFRSSNGPGLGVYLARNAPGLLTTANSVRLDRLKAVSGAQEYNVPASVRINDFDFVVVYCEPFNISFGFARLN
jgi:hypothetical protein